MKPEQRANLLKLADYLDSLPPDYSHFDMHTWMRHRGGCDLPLDEDVMMIERPAEFLSNCGTVACAAGHGPAAGIPFKSGEFELGIDNDWGDINWNRYITRAFGVELTFVFDFLFGSKWRIYDNHHYGAAARIRYLLDKEEDDQAIFFPESHRYDREVYASYRKV